MEPDSDTFNLKSLDEILKNKECVMNTPGYFFDPKVYKVFKCKCLGNEIIMCESCGINCHKGHLDNMMIQEEKEYKSFFCECAKNNHISQKKEENEHKTLERTSKGCELIQFMNFSKIKWYWQKNNNIIFHVCYNHQSIPKNEYVNVIINKLNPDLKCSCESSDHHFKRDNPLLFLLEKKSETLNVDQICHALISEPSLSKFFVDIINEKTTDIRKKISFNNYDEYQRQKDLLYNELMRFVNKFAKHNYRYLPKNIKLHLIFDFQFLEELYSTKEINKDYFAKVKYFALYNFRKLKIMSTIKNKFSSLMGYDKNTTFLHRLLLQENIDDFCNQIDVPYNKLCNLFKKVFHSIVFYSKNLRSGQSEIEFEKVFIKLLKENLKYIKLFLNYKLDKDFLNDIILSLNKITENLISNY